MDKNISNFDAICVSKDEKEVIEDIRSLEFGKVTVAIQNGYIVSREVTKTIRNVRNGNGNNNIHKDISRNLE